MEGIGSDPDLSSLKLQGFEHSLSFGWWVLSDLAVVLSGIRFLEANSAPCALLLGTAQISCSLSTDRRRTRLVTRSARVISRACSRHGENRHSKGKVLKLLASLRRTLLSGPPEKVWRVSGKVTVLA